MTRKAWFSAMVVFVVQVSGPGGESRLQKSVYLVKATDFDDALSTVVARARKDEEAYKNSDDEWVRWMLVEVETLDWLGEKIEDGREVYSEPRFDVPLSTYPLPYRPELSKPTQSGV